jgi:Domain of unknown function (DUF4326)
LEYNDDKTFVEIKNNFSLESMLETYYGKSEEVFRKILQEEETIKIQHVRQNIMYQQKILANKNNFFVKSQIQSPISTEQVTNSISQTEAEKKEINEKCMYSPNLLFSTNNNEVQKTRLVHCMKEPYDIYIGRGYHDYKRDIHLIESKWSNPYRIDVDGTREEVIEKYRDYIINERPDLIASLSELEGKRLGCWCVPNPCHGDVLIELVNDKNREGYDNKKIQHRNIGNFR